jgi:ribosomal-protein-alanine N-acetyltransferase
MTRADVVGLSGTWLRLPDAHRWPVTISYGGVVLAPFRSRDREEWCRVRRRNQAWLQPWDATEPTGGQRRDVREMVARQNREARAGRLVPWLIRDGNSAGRPPLIGQCTLSNIVMGSARFASVGYWIDQLYAGRGITPLAVALTVDYAMRVMGLHRVEICVLPENAASLRVVEKLGFREEGVRARYIHIAGAWRDHRCFAIDTSEVGGGLVARLTGAGR